MRFHKERDIRMPRNSHSYKHPGIQQNKITTKTDLNKCEFRISGAVENNIPGVEPACPNSKMLLFKLINIPLTKVDLGFVELVETLILEKRLCRTSIFNEYYTTNQSNLLLIILLTIHLQHRQKVINNG